MMLLAARHSLRPHARSFYSTRFNRTGALGCLRRRFTVLALESSADDTCAAVVTSEREILSNVVLSQRNNVETHGGIEPFVAIQEHQRNMPIAVRRALEEAKLDMSHIDGVAFTRGPGMGGCLSVCSNAAKTLAAALGKPIVGVHHMQAHALTPVLTAPNPSSIPTFPFLTLLISGGHTLLLLALSNSRFKVLATTRDEAVGRSIDKVARELRLEWKGRSPGAALEAFCRDGLVGVKEADVLRVEPLKVPFKGELAFSFAGLHSAVDRYILQHGVPLESFSVKEESPSPSAPAYGIGRENESKRIGLTKKDRIQLQLQLPNTHRLAIARAFQSAAVAQLEEKVILALRWCANNQQAILRDFPTGEERSQLQERRVPVKHVVVSGGVASNLFLRDRLQACLAKNFPEEDLSLVFPPPALCTDNAAMIAWASMHRFLAGDSDDYSIDHRAKWGIEELGSV